MHLLLGTVQLAGHTGNCARRRLLHASAVDDPCTLRCASLSGRGAVSVFSPSIVFSFLELMRSAQTSSSRRRSSHRPKLATPHRFVAPGAAQTRRPSTPTTHERDRALHRPKSSAQTTARHHRARRTSPSPSNSPLRPPSAQIESPVSFSALSSPFPTLSPLESRTAGAGAPPRCRGSPVAPPAHAARHPCVGLLVAAERPEVAEHPSSLRRPLPLAPCFAMAGTARPPRAAASRHRPWPWRRRGPPARSPLRRPAGALAPLGRPDHGPARPRRWPAAAVGRGAAPPPSLAAATALACVRGRAGEPPLSLLFH